MSVAVVIPVFNEEKNIKSVVIEWDIELKKLNISHKFYIIDDGSTDKTSFEIKKIKKKIPIKYFKTKNQGHGNACIYGYHKAVLSKYNLILQIDSDGQCCPSFIKNFFLKIKYKDAVFGYRYQRKDGIKRFFFSRILELAIFLKTGVICKDPNTPYKLIKKNILKKVLDNLDERIILKNLLLQFLIQKKYKNIGFIPIVFKKRKHGKSKYNYSNMIKQLYNLILFIH